MVAVPPTIRHLTTTKLDRGSDPWTDKRVQSLLKNDTIRADMLPDIRAVVPAHLQIQNEEMLRFSNAIANTGANNLQVRRGSLITNPDQTQIEYFKSLGLDPFYVANTNQELLDKNGTIRVMIPDAGLSEYHPTHKHFHIGETAEFSIEHFNDTTKMWDVETGIGIVKQPFCLIDVEQIRPMAGCNDIDYYETIKSPANANDYFECYADLQGIQDSYIDRYHHSLSGLPAGIYRLVSTVNPSGWYLESDYTNNVGWTSFELVRYSKGNSKVLEIPGNTGGIWFTQSSNGGA